MEKGNDEGIETLNGSMDDLISIILDRGGPPTLATMETRTEVPLISRATSN